MCTRQWVSPETISIARVLFMLGLSELPFGFSVDIGEIQNNFNISQRGETVAGLSTVSHLGSSLRKYS